MEISDYIRKLSELEENANCLSKHIGLEVEVYFSSVDSTIDIICADVEADEIRYHKDFDRLEKASEHLEALCIGAMLAKGMEV